MKLASFFSGGKDSIFSINIAKEHGHDVNCLLTILSNSEESHLLHHPNLNWTNLQAQSMDIEQLTISSFSDNTNDELDLFEKLIYDAKKKFQIDGIVHGGIKSKFQKNNFEKITNPDSPSAVAFKAAAKNIAAQCSILAAKLQEEMAAESNSEGASETPAPDSTQN
jgi:diphthine-ammonia ligase